VSGVISGLKPYALIQPFFVNLLSFVKNTLRADRREEFFAVPNAFLKGNTCFRCIFRVNFRLRRANWIVKLA